jgi:hypothetical protein
MALAEVILEIAQDLEDSAEEWKEIEEIAPHVAEMILSFAKQLRRAVKAAEGSAPPPPQKTFMQEALEMEKHFKERARTEFKGKVQKIPPNELDRKDGGGKSVYTQMEVVGGPAAPDDLPVWHGFLAGFETGVKTVIAGGVYELREDNKWHHLPSVPTKEEKKIVLG